MHNYYYYNDLFYGWHRWHVSPLSRIVSSMFIFHAIIGLPLSFYLEATSRVSYYTIYHSTSSGHVHTMLTASFYWYQYACVNSRSIPCFCILVLWVYAPSPVIYLLSLALFFVLISHASAPYVPVRFTMALYGRSFTFFL